MLGKSGGILYNVCDEPTGHESFSPKIVAVMEHGMTSPFLSRRLAALCVLGLACLAAAGCGGSQKKSLAVQQSGLKKLARVYGQFLTQHRGQPPANEAEFKKYAQSLNADDLASLGVKKADQIFLSDRDNKPYVVIYGQPKGPAGPGGSPVIAYEQEGQAGKRWVASALGAVEEVDEARFRELIPTAKP
jgi:hypothetical protein